MVVGNSATPLGVIPGGAAVSGCVRRLTGSTTRRTHLSCRITTDATHASARSPHSSQLHYIGAPPVQWDLIAPSGSVALSVGLIEADLSGEGVDSFSLVAAVEVGVRWLPLPAGGDRRRGSLVPAV
jgi:hypothetical protein